MKLYIHICLWLFTFVSYGQPRVFKELSENILLDVNQLSFSSKIQEDYYLVWFKNQFFKIQVEGFGKIYEPDFASSSNIHKLMKERIKFSGSKAMISFKEHQLNNTGSTYLSFRKFFEMYKQGKFGKR